MVPFFNFEHPGSSSIKINSGDPGAVEKIYLYLSDRLEKVQGVEKNPVVLCIGSDRATGDSLGPLTGSKLTGLCSNTCPVFGTLKEPVHALNLKEYIKYIYAITENPFVIAVDASLGRLESVGCIEMGLGTIKPGLAVQKKLPPVGDLYITGIVNIGGFMEQMILQSTRLYQVMHMAEAISRGIHKALQESYLQNAVPVGTGRRPFPSRQ